MKGPGRLGWWLRDYVYAGWRQLQSVFRRSTPTRYSTGDPGLPAIVLLPGVYETWLFLEPAATRLNAAGFKVFTVPELGTNRLTVPESAALVTAALAKLAAAHDVSAFILLAHSKGGLIGKHVMLDAELLKAELLKHDGEGQLPAPARLGADAGSAEVARPVKVLGMVAVAAPFSGSPYARYLLSRTLRDFSPADVVLVALQGQKTLNHKVVSIYPEFDPHIPGGSALPGAVNVQLPVSGHFRTLGDGAVLAAVEQAVAGFGTKPGH